MGKLWGREPETAMATLTVPLGAIRFEAPSIRQTAHIMSDPQIVAHCPFCGSGAIVANGDETIACTFCDRAFLVMEQPKFNSMPVDPNAQPPASGLPGAADAPVDPNDPNADPAAAGAAPAHAPTNPQTDPAELAKAPAFKMGAASPRRQFKTAVGHKLNEDDFVRHVAYTLDREFLTAGR